MKNSTVIHFKGRPVLEVDEVQILNSILHKTFLVYSPIVHHPDHNYVKFLWENHESAMLDLRKFLSDKGVLRRSCLLQCIPLVRPSKSYLSAYDAVANFSLRGFSNEYRSCTVDGIQYEMSWHELYDPQLYAHNHPSHVRPYKSPPTAKSEFSNYVLGYPHHLDESGQRCVYCGMVQSSISCAAAPELKESGAPEFIGTAPVVAPLEEEFAPMPKIGGIYRHYKDPKSEYVVMTLATDEAIGELVVVYEDLKKVWTRTVKSWRTLVERDGMRIYRFERIW